MDLEEWKSVGYVKTAGELRAFFVIQYLQQQRPWHSKIRLPTVADDGLDDDFCHLESYDLDCLLVVVRMLVSLGFVEEYRHPSAPVMICALHNFGWDRRADYQVKGLFVQKLFPDSLDNMDLLRSKLTFENLLKHPEIDKVIFSCRAFGLKSCQLLVSDPAHKNLVESIQESSYEEITDANQVNWDGVKTLGEAVAEQSYEIDPMAENGTKIYRRFCAVPEWIRVMFTPDKDHPKGFCDVQRFKLVARTLEKQGDRVRSGMSDSTYILRAVVKVDPQNPIRNPAEVRLYEFDATMILPDIQSNNDHRSVIKQKIRPDSRWTVGDPKFKFMLFYARWDPDVEFSHPPPIDRSAAERLSPRPLYDFYFPILPEYDAQRSQGKRPRMDSLVVDVSKRQALGVDSHPGQSLTSKYVKRLPTVSEDEQLTIQTLKIDSKFPSAPDSYLDLNTLRGSYWNAEIEKDFQELWVRDEHNSRFKQGLRIDSDELELWKMLLIRYRSIPPHLFTYGLKLGEYCYESPGSIMMSSQASYMLQKICAHQIWGQDLDTLRYVLQVAVQISMGEHWDPIVPLPKRNDILPYCGDMETEEGKARFWDLQYVVAMQSNPANRPEIRRLIRQLECNIEPGPSGELEKTFFCLTMGVMRGVLQTLDEFDRSTYPLNVEACVEEFRRYYGDVLPKIEPLDNKHLMDIKWSLELCELRDSEIRKALVLGEFLYDIPHRYVKHSDDTPMYHYYKLMDQRALPALRGEAIDRKRATLNELDRVDNNRAKALHEFTERLKRSVLKVPSPTEAPSLIKSAKLADPVEASKATYLLELFEAFELMDWAKEEGKETMDTSNPSPIYDQPAENETLIANSQSRTSDGIAHKPSQSRCLDNDAGKVRSAEAASLPSGSQLSEPPSDGESMVFNPGNVNSIAPEIDAGNEPVMELARRGLASMQRMPSVNTTVQTGYIAEPAARTQSGGSRAPSALDEECGPSGFRVKRVAGMEDF